ncbi:DUF3426 domain-containing protein [Paraburkholderia sp. LEh10]|uniref:zinc-ribbon and DUF3426 domain-containing protein n=1 Tax=Paraburkholderia sp. LEh10 TaxID=2821353 RepID=UPI001AE29367|nr:zinc-ribbon and DUF3426 domain-containing protein [Paraburkholderia sp. LEh10]MBP0591880.1 DUF3426 domain-containing protein [Paraburkholderia sp. LEh10]
MLLATRCPFCETVFRLLPEQLTLRRGLVRCGHCREVFDASSSLFDVSDGTSLDKARPVTIDDVTAHTLEMTASGGHATARETKPAADARPAPDVRADVRAAVPPGAAAHGAEPVVEQADAQPAATAAPSLEREPHEHATEPAVSAEGAHPAEALSQQHTAGQSAQPSVEAESIPVAPGTVPPVEPSREHVDDRGTSSQGSPDFRAEAWNPWAPAPDASIDRRIRHDASSIPVNPVTIPRSAQPPLTLELTDSQPLNDGQATAHTSAVPRGEAQVEREAAAQGEAAAEPPESPQAAPKTEQPAAAQGEHKVEPRFDAMRERVLDQQVEEPPTHRWRKAEAEPSPESTQARRAQTANEPKSEPASPLNEPRHETRHEPPRDGPQTSAGDDHTFTPSAEHGRGREPYFGAPSGDADFEPRFGATAHEPYGAPFGGDSGAPFGGPFAAAPDGGDDAFAVTREPREPESTRVAWQIAGGIAAALLGALLLVQLAWWQRESVMVAWPDSQSLFVKACSHLGCKIEPPRDIDGLLVEPSDLRQIDGPHKLELKMPLRNRFDLALAYPAVELTLLDENNNIAVRRVLWPQDYVKPGTPIAAGLPARTTQTMIVRLDTGDAVASNFRVQIFYP